MRLDQLPLRTASRIAAIDVATARERPLRLGFNKGRWRINDRVFGDHVRIVRATASYPFEFGKWMKQFVVLSTETVRDELFNFRRNFANVACSRARSLAFLLRSFAFTTRSASRAFFVLRLLFS